MFIFSPTNISGGNNWATCGWRTLARCQQVGEVLNLHGGAADTACTSRQRARRRPHHGTWDTADPNSRLVNDSWRPLLAEVPNSTLSVVDVPRRRERRQPRRQTRRIAVVRPQQPFHFRGAERIVRRSDGQPADNVRTEIQLIRDCCVMPLPKPTYPPAAVSFPHKPAARPGPAPPPRRRTDRAANRKNRRCSRSRNPSSSAHTRTTCSP